MFFICLFTGRQTETVKCLPSHLMIKIGYIIKSDEEAYGKCSHLTGRKAVAEVQVKYIEWHTGRN